MLEQDKMPVTNALQREYLELLYKKACDIRFHINNINEKAHEDKSFIIWKRELYDITMLADKLFAKLKAIEL